MRHMVRIIGILVVIGVVVAGAVFGYIWFTGGDGTPSQEALAAPVEVDETASGTTFEIVSDESEARFTLQEDLRGVRTTVVGTTSEIAGQVFVDFDNPANSEIGTIQINVRTLATDSSMRDRMIRGQILQSNEDAFEFATFEPTSVSGLPDSITTGESFTLQITGSLTVRDITHEVTFDATVTPASETRLEGTATTVILRSDYELQIPDVPSVANVTDEVTLELDFVAVPVEDPTAS